MNLVCLYIFWYSNNVLGTLLLALSDYFRSFTQPVFSIVFINLWIVDSFELHSKKLMNFTIWMFLGLTIFITLRLCLVLLLNMAKMRSVQILCNTDIETRLFKNFLYIFPFLSDIYCHACSFESLLPIITACKMCLIHNVSRVHKLLMMKLNDWR